MYENYRGIVLSDTCCKILARHKKEDTVTISVNGIRRWLKSNAKSRKGLVKITRQLEKEAENFAFEINQKKPKYILMIDIQQK